MAWALATAEPEIGPMYIKFQSSDQPFPSSQVMWDVTVSDLRWQVKDSSKHKHRSQRIQFGHYRDASKK